MEEVPLTEPVNVVAVTAAPAPKKPSLVSRLKVVVAWALSRQGRAEIAAFGVAVYTIWHRAGL